jgi:hypothetical protein
MFVLFVESQFRHVQHPMEEDLGKLEFVRRAS